MAPISTAFRSDEPSTAHRRTLEGVVAAALLAISCAASADVVTLDFEGLKNFEAIQGFYNGGTGDQGSIGPNYGVSFTSATLAIIDEDAGGTGNIANEPSPSTVMFFTGSATPILNYAAGFDTGFSFFYTSATAATVTVWSGLDGTGTLLGSITVDAQYNLNCPATEPGNFCNWSIGSLGFAGVGRSINFGGTASRTAYDNITFGSTSPSNGVPTPGTMLLIGSALLGLGAVRRRRA